MTEPPFGPPPGDPGRRDDPPLPPPVPPGPGVEPGSYLPPSSPPGSAYGGWSDPQDHQGRPWQQLPPEQVARLHQPGIVPLRPLTLGDIFGGALQTMRRNPEATIGLGLVVHAVLLVPSLLLTLLVVRSLRGMAEVDLSSITLLISTVLSALASVALTGMIVHVVGEAVLGDRAGLGSTWRAVRGRIPALIGTILLMGLIFAGLTVGLVVAVVLLALAVDGGGTTSVLAVVGIVLLVLGAVVTFVWLGSRLSLASAAVVLERVGPARGIARAWRLSTGGQGWRITGITVLAGIVTNLCATLVTLPVVFLLLAGLGGVGVDTAATSPWVLLTDHLVQLVVGALTIPFTAGVTALLYLDQRIRREGLDVALVQAAQSRAADRTR